MQNILYLMKPKGSLSGSQMSTYANYSQYTSSRRTHQGPIQNEWEHITTQPRNVIKLCSSGESVTRGLETQHNISYHQSLWTNSKIWFPGSTNRNMSFQRHYSTWTTKPAVPFTNILTYLCRLNLKQCLVYQASNSTSGLIKGQAMMIKNHVTQLKLHVKCNHISALWP